ncbi:12716_t:CDS:10 [Gigaspora margarita]|uniref:12716_t:CDS:1 n=1 Tax=Gigaspora margarita TaxID=4874 RepID=A0ABN7UXL1_GIGMA|nr:12716_t:CDS:10 [Gigaspora margarita]
MESEQPITSPMFTNSLMMEPSKKLNGITSIVRDPSRSAVAELRRLSSMSVKKDLSDLQIPTITENAEDVTGLKGRIRLQKTDERRNSRNWADQQRKNLQAYEYLCHIGEAKDHLLSRRGLTGRIKNLVGKLEFTDEQLHLTQRGLDASGVIMPSFANVGNNAIVRCQAIARTHMARKHLLERRALHEYSLPFIVRLQSQIRGWLVRTEWNNRLNQMEKLERWVVNLQSLARGALARSKFRDRFSHYQKNVDKVIKIQSLYRAKHAGDAYRSLILGNNPPVTTIKNFIHLLNDSDFDFDEEIELERLRQAVIQRIRENNQSEDLLNQLDIKIALLVKNRITIDEVLAVANSKKRIRRLSQLTSPQSPFSLKSLDKVSHRRLELYQQLFYLLQTQPMYLARLFFIMNKMSFPEKTKKLVEGVVLTLFGYAQNAREEYLLLKLFQKSMMQELENMDSLQEFLRGNFMFMKLVVHYNRGAKERKFLRDLLSPLVKQVMDDEFMDLETDPLKVYRNLINAEELRTGLPSNKPIDISQQDALNDPETRTVFIHHLQRLRKETENFLTTIINSIGKMPFGIRYIAKELKKSLMSKFSNESEDSVIKVVGHLIYYRYLNPAIVAPEGFDVIDTVVSPMQRKNLAEISKMLNQISVGKLFSEDNMYLQPLNEYVAYASDRFLKFFKEVGEAESFFGIDEFDDLTKTNKPIIYISPIEVFSTHELLMQRLEDIAPQPNDILRQIFNELGEAPPIEEDLSDTATKEISLTLTSRLALEAMNDPDTEIKHLFVETKRLVLAVMRVQNGENLLDILVKAVTDQDEKIYAEICKTDKKNKDRQPVDGSNDITEMKFMDLKKLTLQNILRLEKEGKIFRRTNYQEILNAIAVDIRNKHRRRVQRQKELRQLRQTLVNLDEKRVHLDDQIKTYNDHIDVCMQQLTTKKGKKHRLVLPFTRQYFHIRELQKSGKVPRFGSFKYTAQRLREKGVLLSISGYSTFDKISFTISSDEVGIFSIEASYAGVPVPGASMELRLEDLLQSQFNNTQVMNLFDGVAKVNVNLLIFLINKKFFV